MKSAAEVEPRIVSDGIGQNRTTVLFGQKALHYIGNHQCVRNDISTGVENIEKALSPRLLVPDPTYVTFIFVM